MANTAWNPPKQTIIDMLKKHNGLIIRAAQEFKIHRQTLGKKIKEDPELVELVENLKYDYQEGLLDLAEEALNYALEQKNQDINAALKSAFFTLNSRGQSRGYNNTNVGTGNLYIVRQDPTKRDSDSDTSQI